MKMYLPCLRFPNALSQYSQPVACIFSKEFTEGSKCFRELVDLESISDFSVIRSLVDDEKKAYDIAENFAKYIQRTTHDDYYSNKKDAELRRDILGGIDPLYEITILPYEVTLDFQRN